MVVAKLVKRRLDDYERRLKRIEEVLEFSPAVTSFDWKDFSDRDKDILAVLLEAGREGTTTTEVATKLELLNPETSGRAVVWKRLRRVEKISVQIKGFPLVRLVRKRWSLNFDDFTFDVKEEE